MLTFVDVMLIFTGFTFILFGLPVVFCAKEAFHRDLRFLTEAGEIYVKLITILFRYTIR